MDRRRRIGNHHIHPKGYRGTGDPAERISCVHRSQHTCHYGMLAAELYYLLRTSVLWELKNYGRVLCVSVWGKGGNSSMNIDRIINNLCATHTVTWTTLGRAVFPFCLNTLKFTFQTELVKIYWKSDTIRWNTLTTTIRCQYVWISMDHVQIVFLLYCYLPFLLLNFFWITFIKNPKRLNARFMCRFILCRHTTFVSRNELTFWTRLNSFLSSLWKTYFFNFRFI